MTHTTGKQSRFLNWLKWLVTLVRIPNLLIVILIELLLRCCVLKPILFGGDPQYLTALPDYIVFILATVLLAAGGYVINDYFDVRIDRVNKPESVVVSKMIQPRSAMKLHLLLNAVAVVLGFYLSWRIRSLWFGLLFPCGALFFWFYSARWKQLFIWKNLIVAFISATLIVLVLLFEFFHLRLNPDFFATVIGNLKGVALVFLAYACFAFLVSLFREVIKDMEDIKGDAQFGTHSLPSVIGITWSKVIVVGIIVLAMALLSYCQLVIFRLGLAGLFWYLAVAVQLPALFLIITVIKAEKKQQFRFASGISKLIMLTGILSMIFISFRF
ncbi:MAG: geranylgeranylglycerol-phosphate geranylgeranyltransferase [bacterium]